MSLHAEELSLKLAVDAIRSGKLVAFPTETVYGLGANALDASAVRQIFEAKKRPWASPLIVHVADVQMARTITAEWPAIAGKLADRFWPGPLTLVLRKAAIIPDVVTANLATVGVRIPGHPLALSLIRNAGVPIAAPSANPFTEISPTTAEHVRSTLGNAVEAIVDGGPSSVGIESTVVALHRNPPVVLRPGMISRQELEEVSGVRFELEEYRPEIVESPGQHPRHYAPRTPLYLLAEGQPKPTGSGRILDLPSEPTAFAALLYAALHEADKESLDWIGITVPPDTPEWAAIRDRLRRASTTL